MSANAWDIFTVEELARRVEGCEPRLVEFIRAAGLTCAVYRLPTGSKDMQAPHLEDEVYFVLAGRARLRVGGQEQAVLPAASYSCGQRSSTHSSTSKRT